MKVLRFLGFLWIAAYSHFALAGGMGGYPLLGIIGPQTGAQKPQLGGPDAVCRLTRISKNGDVHNCSGTLISHREILTAAHCVRGAEMGDRIEVGCGFRGALEKTNKTRLLESGFIEWFEPQEILIARDYQPATATADVAKIILDRDSKITPIPVATPPEFAILTPELTARAKVECRISGYGYAKGFGGVLYTAKTLPPTLVSKGYHILFGSDVTGVFQSSDDQDRCNDLNKIPENKRDGGWVWNILDAIAAGAALKGSVVGPGDSGGPLYCRQSAKAPWKLIGAANEIGFETDGSPKLVYSQRWEVADEKKFISIWKAGQ